MTESLEKFPQLELLWTCDFCLLGISQLTLWKGLRFRTDLPRLGRLGGTSHAPHGGFVFFEESAVGRWQRWKV